MPTKKTEKPSDGSATLKLVVKLKDHQAAYQQVLKRAASSVELPGFRKGKAPISMIERKLDKSRLYSQVIELVLPPVYAAAVKKANLTPLTEPQITPLKMQEGKDWEFEAKIASTPEVKLGKYREEIKKALAKAKKSKEKKDKDWELQAVLDVVLSTSQVEPAELLIEREAHSALHRLESQLSSMKLTLADYLKSIKKSEKSLHQEYHNTARDNLRLEFALKAIVDKENPDVTASEIAALKPNKSQEPYAKYLVQKRKVLDTLVKL